MKTPPLDEVIHYFQKVDTEKLTFTDGMKIAYYTDQFTYYRFPIGDELKEVKVKALIDLIINHEALHMEYPGRFIRFFHKNFNYFNEEQRKRISSALVKPIGSDFEDYYEVINLYQVKEFAPQIESLLSDNIVIKIKKSFLNERTLSKYKKEFKEISILANLDSAYQDTLLGIIRYCYDFTNNPKNELSRRKKNSLKSYLYGLVLKRSISNLTDKSGLISQTLYLLNEECVLYDGHELEVDCAYRYYEYMILPLLAKNRLAMDEFLKTGGDDRAYFRSLFEKYRTPELMRAALIEFGILDK